MELYGLFPEYHRTLKEDLQERKKRKKEVMECDHLLVLLEEDDYVGAFNSSDCFNVDPTAECLKCGTTNKFVGLERCLESYSNTLFAGLYSDETALFHGQFEYWGESFRDKDGNSIELILPKIMKTIHPGILYRLATLINPDGSNEELANRMLELISLETEKERLKMCSMEDAKDLLERYQKIQKTELVKRLTRVLKHRADGQQNSK